MVLPAILLYELANTVPICCRFFCRIFQCYYITVFTPSTRSQYATVLACCFDLGNTGLLCCRFFCCIFHGHYASVLTAVLSYCIALVKTAGYCLVYLLVYLLVYWLVPPRFPMTWPAYLHCFIEIQPVCISISRSRHEAILLESCLRAKLATLQGFSAAAVIPHLTRVVAMSRGRGGRVSTPKRSGTGRSGPGSSEASIVFAVLLYFLVYFW